MKKKTERFGNASKALASATRHTNWIALPREDFFSERLHLRLDLLLLLYQDKRRENGFNF